VFHQWMVREHLGLRVAETAAHCEDADLERWWRAARHFPWGALPAAVREAELLKIPYIVILGDKELEQGTVSFRSRKEPNRNGVPVEAFVEHLSRNAAGRVLEISPLG